MYNQEITAIVVARKGSKRVPNKNMLPLDGQPLFLRKLTQLINSKYIDRVVFGSDSDEMLKIANSLKQVECIKRDNYHCDETKASANDMIYDMCSKIKTDIVLWAHCTNPLISNNTYEKAIETYYNNECDSLLSVVELREHLWKDGKPLNYNPYQERHTPARELPPLYMQDGGIFIQPHYQMLKNKYFFGKNPYLFVIPNDEFLDINEYRDYLLAKSIIEWKTKKNNY